MTTDLLNVALQLPEIAIHDVHRIGKVKGKRPIIVKFIGVRWVKTVFCEISEYKKFKISIVNNRRKLQREQIKLILNQEDKLKNAGISAVIKRNKLFVQHKEVEP